MTNRNRAVELHRKEGWGAWRIKRHLALFEDEKTIVRWIDDWIVQERDTEIKAIHNSRHTEQIKTMQKIVYELLEQISILEATLNDSDNTK